MYYCVPAVLFLLSWSLFFGFGVGVGVGISATSVYGYWYCICIGVLLRVGLSKKDVRVRSLGSLSCGVWAEDSANGESCIEVEAGDSAAYPIVKLVKVLVLVLHFILGDDDGDGDVFVVLPCHRLW